MATQLDLQEQEQLDALKAFWKQYGNLITWTVTLALAAFAAWNGWNWYQREQAIKAFWKQYGNLITWTLTLALAAFAAWNGWNWYQREQAIKASVMHDEIDKAAAAGDAERAARIFADLRERYPRTAYAQQAGLQLAKLQADKGKADEARAALAWVAENAIEDEYKTVARLRLAGLQLDAKQFDDALKQLDAAMAAGFEALVADRRGDVLLAQGKKAEAVAAYKSAHAGLPATLDYRRVVEAKLASLGAAPAPAAAASAASGAQS